MYKYLALAGAFLVTVLSFLAQTLRLKNAKQKLKHAQAESDALGRHSNGLMEGQKKYDEITDTELDRDHFNRVLEYPRSGKSSDTRTH